MSAIDDYEALQEIEFQLRKLQIDKQKREHMLIEKLAKNGQFDLLQLNKPLMNRRHIKEYLMQAEF